MTTCHPLVKSTARNIPASVREASARTRLESRQTFSRVLAEGEILRLRVCSGHLWVTLEGAPDDHVLGSGDLQQFTGPGLWVAEGLGSGAEFEAG